MESLIPIIIWGALFAGLCSLVAFKKGKSVPFWCVLGVLFGFISLIIVLCLKKDHEAIAMRDEVAKKCPYCAEWVKQEAIICRFCRNKLSKNKGG